MANLVGITISVKDEATGQIRQIRATADDMPNSPGVKSGFGMGIGAGIAMQATQMVLSSVEGMASSVISEALDMETSQARLGQAFIDAGDNMATQQDAINGLVTKNAALGFSEQETIDSLAKLVTATGSLAAAQEFQAAAMDLARFKGISLAEATDAMTKVEAGQYRALKALGIVLPAHATALEALTAVEEKAGGQALTFSKTTAGAMDDLDASIKDLEVSIGEGLLPIVKGIADGLKNLVDASHQLQVATGATSDDFHKEEVQLRSTADGARDLLMMFKNPDWIASHKGLTDAIYADADALTQLGLVAPATADAIDAGAQDIDLKARAALQAIPDAATDAEVKTVAVVQKTFTDVANTIRAGRDEIVKAMQQVISDAYDPLINKAQQAADLQAIADTQTALSKKKLTAAEKEQLTLQLLNQQKAYADDLAAATQYGSDAARKAALTAELSSKALIAGLNSNDPEVAAAARAMRDSINAELDRITIDAGDGGTAAGDIYMKNLKNSIVKGTPDVIEVLKKLGKTLKASSPPGPESPLHLIDEWGRKTGEAYVKGLATGLAPVGGLMGSLGAPSGGGAKVGGGSSISVVVNNPKPETASTSVQRELLKLAALGYIGG